MIEYPLKLLKSITEIFEEEVDWSEHKSKLVKCRKCQRNFFPYRIAVHEKNCIKI